MKLLTKAIRDTIPKLYEQELHGDEEFFYAIRRQPKGCVVEVWDIPKVNWSGDFKDAKLVKKTLVDVAEQEKAK